jgi:flagellar motor switch protein FliM
MSTSDVLSQDEIDALLSGVDDGEVETEAEELQDSGEARSYDFNSQDRIVRGRMPTLEMINERFARNIRIGLFTMMRRSPSISVEGIQMTKFSEYVHSLFMPSNLNMVKMAPLRGVILMVMNPKLVFTLVDNYFGGDGRFHAKIEGRDFTATEMRIVQKVLDQIFIDLAKAWEPVMPVEFSYLGSEVNPQFANIVTPSEVLVVSSFHIELEGGSGDFHITIPYSMIEPIREILDAGIQSDAADVDHRWINSLREELKTADVEIHSGLTETKILVRDLLKMQAGDIIPIEMPEFVVARVDDIPVFKGQFGVSRGNCALKIDEMIRPVEYDAPKLLEHK